MSYARRDAFLQSWAAQSTIPTGSGCSQFLLLVRTRSQLSASSRWRGGAGPSFGNPAPVDVALNVIILPTGDDGISDQPTQH